MKRAHIILKTVEECNDNCQIRAKSKIGIYWTLEVSKVLITSTLYQYKTITNLREI